MAARKKATAKKAARKKATISNGATPGRSKSGRFAEGWKGGPGNPNVRLLSQYQQAIRDAFSPADLVAVLKDMHAIALDPEQDSRARIAAAEALMQRVLGKTREADPELNLELPAMPDAKGCDDAAAAVVGALSAQVVGLSSARQAIDLIEARRKVIETRDHEARLAVLEALQK